MGGIALARACMQRRRRHFYSRRGYDLRPRTDAKGTLAGMGPLAVCALRCAASCRYELGTRLGTSLSVLGNFALMQVLVPNFQRGAG